MVINQTTAMLIKTSHLLLFLILRLIPSYAFPIQPHQHRLHTILFDSDYVQSKVGRTSIVGQTREGRAFVTALETDVRNALSPTAAATDSVGLSITIDATTVPEIQLHQRITFRPLRHLPETTSPDAPARCETTCGDGTLNNNETCPILTYLEIIGRPHSTTASYPTLRQIDNSPAYGLFHIDTNPTDDLDSDTNNCGVTYETNVNRQAKSSTQIILSLKNVVLSHTLHVFPAIFMTTVQRSDVLSNANNPLRSSLLLLSNVVLQNGDGNNGSPSVISLLAKDASISASINHTIIQNNVNLMASALFMSNLGGDTTVQLNAQLNNCTFRDNTNGLRSITSSALSLTSLSPIGQHNLILKDSTFQSNTNGAPSSSSSSTCQIWIRTNSVQTLKSNIIDTIFEPTPLDTFCVAQTVTPCLRGEGMVQIGTCTSCSKGKYSLGGNNAECLDCVGGQYSANVGSSSCNKCVAGKTSGVLNDNSGINSGGKRNQVGGVRGASICVDCSAGTYASVQGSAICMECAAGKSSRRPSSSSSTSEDGEDGDGNSGDAAVGGAVLCFDCEMGKYASDIGNEICSNCAIGLYQNNLNQVLCFNCALGKYSNSIGSKSCIDCEAGTYTNTKASTTCKICLGDGNITKTNKNILNATGIGNIDCVPIPPTPSTTNEDLNDSILIPIVIGVVSFILVVSVVMGYWVVVQRNRRMARMILPEFPDGGEDQGVEMITERTPASIIQDQFDSHDTDHDGHIDFDELINLVREIIGVTNASEDAFQQIATILLKSVDTDGNGTLEQDEFTMLCLRVMRWPSHDVDSRLIRMVPHANNEERELLKYFFSHMNRWFMRKLSVIRRNSQINLENGHGVNSPGSEGSHFDPAEENDRREAEAVSFNAWEEKTALYDGR